ncbi:MAG TPA: hypothetical protein VFN90_08890 [Gemmatimonadales bacterium]|nr:hypothetical protein [Gemmatimonadales bacterium]
MSKIRVLPALLLAAACRAEFVPDPTGPGGNPLPPVGPAIPFRIGSINPEEARGVVALGDGSVVVASWFTGTVDFDPTSEARPRTSFGGQDVGVARYREDGSILWAYGFGGAGTEIPNAIAATPDGGVVIVGTGQGGNCNGRVLTSLGGSDGLILKLSAAGTCEWAQLIGGSQDDDIRAVSVGTDGTIVVAGSFRQTIDLDPTGGAALLVSRGGSDAFAARYTEDGEFIGGVQGGGLEDDAYNAVQQTLGGDVLVVGEFALNAAFGPPNAPLVLQSAGATDIVLARYADDFTLGFATRAGGPGIDRGLGIALEPDGSVTIAGTFEGVADLDPGPSAALVTSRGATDIFVSRYDGLSGVWVGLATSVGGIGSEGLTGFRRLNGADLLLTGFFQESVDFDPTAGATIVNARGTGGAGDAFALVLGTQGEFRWVTPIGAPIAGAENLAIAAGAAQATDFSLWVVGRFAGRADFDPGATAAELTSAGATDGWVSRYDRNTGALIKE